MTGTRPQLAMLLVSLPDAMPSAGRHAGRGDVPISSAEFVSPEYAGALGARIDERSDLFSLGCVLFAALTGHPPFRAGSVGEVLRRQLEDSPPGVRGEVDAPRALDAFITRLLRTEPRDRYQSAAGARSDLERRAARAAAAGT